MKKIIKIIKRHGAGDFVVEDEDGNWFRVQLAYKLEEVWQKSKSTN